MSVVLGRPLSTVKENKPSRCCLPSSERSKNNIAATTTTIKKTINLIEKRLNHIRIHLLNNKTPLKITHGEPTLILDKFLYLGGLKSLNDKAHLARLNITHILSVVLFPLKKSSIPPHIKHLLLKADDCISFNMTPHFEQACQFIEEARQSNGGILVHCACGVSRSSTLCCAYLIKHHSMSLEQAIVHLRSRRHIIQPNTGFLRQLIHYNEEIDHDQATISEQLENVLSVPLSA